VRVLSSRRLEDTAINEWLAIRQRHAYFNHYFDSATGRRRRLLRIRPLGLWRWSGNRIGNDSNRCSDRLSLGRPALLAVPSEEHTQDGQGVKRRARMSVGVPAYLAARDRTLCSPEIGLVRDGGGIYDTNPNLADRSISKNEPKTAGDHTLSGGCRRVSGSTRNLRYEPKSGRRADLKKRTQSGGGKHVPAGECGWISRSKRNLRYEPKLGLAGRFEKTNPTAVSDPPLGTALSQVHSRLRFSTLIYIWF